MVVLVIAIIALFSLLAVLTHLWGARMNQKARIQNARGNGRLLAGLSFEQAFDESYVLIWETQAPALRMIGSAGEAGVPVKGLKPWFRRAARNYPALYDGFSFEDWLCFLYRAQLVQLSGNRVRLTAEGLGFLDYCGVAHHGE